MTQTSLPPSGRVLLEEEVPGGALWSRAIQRHQTLRLVDGDGGANVGLLLYNRDLLLERYNMPDTLKAQHVAFVTRGVALYSDMGRVLASVTEDSCGWHDTLCGHLGALETVAKYGEKTYQQHRNDFQRNAHDAFLVELGKWGLGPQDVVPNLNFFSKVTVDAEGALSFHAGHSRAGDFVDLRAEMNLLVVLNTGPHPLDPAMPYAPKSIRLVLWSSDPPPADDLCRTSRPENERGFRNTERYFL
jgi:uncharacterized protein